MASGLGLRHTHCYCLVWGEGKLWPTILGHSAFIRAFLEAWEPGILGQDDSLSSPSFFLLRAPMMLGQPIHHCIQPLRSSRRRISTMASGIPHAIVTGFQDIGVVVRSLPLSRKDCDEPLALIMRGASLDKIQHSPA